MSTDIKYPLSLSKLPPEYRENCVKIKEQMFEVLQNGLLLNTHLNTGLDVAIGSTALAQLIFEFLKLFPNEKARNIIDLLYFHNIENIRDNKNFP